MMASRTTIPKVCATVSLIGVKLHRVFGADVLHHTIFTSATRMNTLSDSTGLLI
jgi:hypothetical protein